jgi:hypothetical protein
MVHRPADQPAFEFVVVSGLRAAQLMRGCIARVETGHSKRITIAQLEVASGKVARIPGAATEPAIGAHTAIVGA